MELKLELHVQIVNLYRESTPMLIVLSSGHRDLSGFDFDSRYICTYFVFTLPFQLSTSGKKALYGICVGDADFGLSLLA